MKLRILLFTLLTISSSMLGMEDGNNNNNNANPGHNRREEKRTTQSRPTEHNNNLSSAKKARISNNNNDNSDNQTPITGSAGKMEEDNDNPDVVAQLLDMYKLPTETQTTYAQDIKNEERLAQIADALDNESQVDHDNHIVQKSEIPQVNFSSNNNSATVRLSPIQETRKQALARINKLTQFVKQFKESGKDPIFTIADLAAKNEALRKRSEQYNINLIPDDIIKSEIIPLILTPYTSEGVDEKDGYNTMLGNKQTLSRINKRFNNFMKSQTIKVPFRNFLEYIANQKRMVCLDGRFYFRSGYAPEDLVLKYDALEALDHYIPSTKSKLGQQKIFFSAIEEGAYRITNSFIANGMNIDAKNGHHNTGLIIAIRKELHKMAKFLIKHGANVNHQNIEQRTPLLYAIQANSLENIKVLLEHGAKINQEAIIEALHKKAINTTAAFEIIKFLLEQADKKMLSLMKTQGSTYSPELKELLKAYGILKDF